MLRAPDTCTAFGVLALDEDARRHGAKLAKAAKPLPSTDHIAIFTMDFEPFLAVFCSVCRPMS